MVAHSKLSAESVRHLVVFLSYNKLTNNTFYDNFLAKLKNLES
jgi:hypothetical protein